MLSGAAPSHCPSPCDRLARRANFRFIETANHRLTAAVLFRQEGRSRVVTNAGRDVVDARASARHSGAQDERRLSVRQNRVVLTPRRWRQVCELNSQAMVTTKPGHQGERGISRKAITQGMPGASAEPVGSCAHPLFFAHETAGAARTRHSLRPPFSRVNPMQTSGAPRRESAKSCP